MHYTLLGEYLSLFLGFEIQHGYNERMKILRYPIESVRFGFAAKGK